MAASAARQPPSFGAAANEPPDDDAGSDADGAVLASFPSPSYRGRPRYPLPTAAVGPTPPPGHHPAQSVPGTPQRGLSNGRTGGAPGEDEESLGGSRAAADADADAAARRRHVSRAGIQTSVDAFKHLVATAEEYTAQMLRLAAESAKFAQALETVARSDIGGNGDGAGLQACAGLQHLLANQLQVLGETTKTVFQEPLKAHCGEYEAKVKSDEVEYRQTVAALGEAIRQTEARSYQMGRRGERDLTAFRNALVDITRQVKELETVKAAYYWGVCETQNLSVALILQAAAAVVRAEVDVFERVSQKGFSDPILEPIILSVPDPFESYPSADPGQLFTVLPPLLPATSEIFGAGGVVMIDSAGEGAEPYGGTGPAGDARTVPKHDPAAVSAFASLFGATANEVLRRQQMEDAAAIVGSEVWAEYRSGRSEGSPLVQRGSDGETACGPDDQQVHCASDYGAPDPDEPAPAGIGHPAAYQGSLLRFEDAAAFAASVNRGTSPAPASGAPHPPPAEGEERADAEGAADRGAAQTAGNIVARASAVPTPVLAGGDAVACDLIANHRDHHHPSGGGPLSSSGENDGAPPRHHRSPKLPPSPPGKPCERRADAPACSLTPPAAAAATAAATAAAPPLLPPPPSPVPSRRPPSSDASDFSTCLETSRFDFRHPPSDRAEYSLLVPPDSEVD